MAKLYTITVNGTAYEVEVAEASGFRSGSEGCSGSRSGSEGCSGSRRCQCCFRSYARQGSVC